MLKPNHILLAMNRYKTALLCYVTCLMLCYDNFLKMKSASHNHKPCSWFFLLNSSFHPDEMIKSMACIAHSSERDTYLKGLNWFFVPHLNPWCLPFSSWHRSQHWMQNKMTENDDADNNQQIVLEDRIVPKFSVCFEPCWNLSQYIYFLHSVLDSRSCCFQIFLFRANFFWTS